MVLCERVYMREMSVYIIAQPLTNQLFSVKAHAFFNHYRFVIINPEINNYNYNEYF